MFEQMMASETAAEDATISVVTRAIEARYGSKNAKRVIDSVVMLGHDEEFYEETALGVQSASSYVEGLAAMPFHDVKRGEPYEWMRELERNHETILEELRNGLNDSDGLEKKGNKIWVPAAREDAIAYGPNWRTLVLCDRTKWDETNCKLFPKTTELVKKFKVPAVEVFFARQAPETGIEMHTDFTNFILTSHLGLDVPENECWFKVGNETYWWKNGEGVIVDTSFIHGTMNESKTKDRYVLIIRFWHPGLSQVEINALTFLFDIIENPTPQGIAFANQLADERENVQTNESNSVKKLGRGGKTRKKKKSRRGSSGSGGLGLLEKGMN